MTERIHREVRDNAAYLVIDNQERMNALSLRGLQELAEIYVELNEDPEVWAIVVTGAGDKAFCAGADLKSLQADADAGVRYRAPMLRPHRNVFEVVWETYKPTIAAVNGYAVGGGLELALACDVRIVSRTAQFGALEVKRGMGATFASVMLPRLIPRGIALEFLYGGELHGAEECARWGLVNRLTEPGETLAEAERFVRRILQNAPLTLRRYKEMATKGFELPVPTALRLDVGPNPYTSKDRVAGVRAFSDGSTPTWHGE